MRDPQRIRPLLNKLAAVWERYPDVRLGQLIEGVVQDHRDIFYIEDDKFEELLAKYPQSSDGPSRR